MRVWHSFWQDDCGFVISAEAVLLGTVGIVGATVGLSAMADAVNEEFKETAFAIRSLDQSYSIPGQRSGHAWTAGSEYRQPPVEESLAKLREDIERAERREREEDQREGAKEDPAADQEHPLTPRQQRRLERQRRL